MEWNISLGSADVSWGGVRAIRTAAKETKLIEVARPTNLPCQKRYSVNGVYIYLY